jgi:GT2 family glycosyltransferase
MHALSWWRKTEGSRLIVSVILVSYNTAQMSLEALRCLFSSKGDFELQVIVIDNASKDNSAKIIKEAFPQITLVENKVNVGFGRANNQVLSVINGEYVLLLNTDAFVEPNTIDKTVKHMIDNSEIGVLGVKLLSRDGSLQPSCRFFPTPFNLFVQRFSLQKWRRDVCSLAKVLTVFAHWDR